MFKAPFLSALGTGLGLGAAAIATLAGLDAYEGTKEKVGGLLNRKSEFEVWQKSPAVQKFLRDKHERETMERMLASQPQQQQAA